MWLQLRLQLLEEPKGRSGKSEELGEVERAALWMGILRVHDRSMNAEMMQLKSDLTSGEEPKPQGGVQAQPRESLVLSGDSGRSRVPSGITYIR